MLALGGGWLDAQGRADNLLRRREVSGVLVGVSAVPCALVSAWLPCVGVAFTGHPRQLPKTKHLPRYRSVRCNPEVKLQ